MPGQPWAATTDPDLHTRVSVRVKEGMKQLPLGKCVSTISLDCLPQRALGRTPVCTHAHWGPRAASRCPHTHPSADATFILYHGRNRTPSTQTLLRVTAGEAPQVPQAGTH